MRALIVFFSSLASSQAWAHGGEADAQWTFDPWIIGYLIALAAPYAVGSVAMFRHAQARRGLLIRSALYAAGWLALAGALVSPLHALGGRMLTFHMIEHEILMAISAPLMVAARPLGAVLWALPSIAGAAFQCAGSRRLWRWMTAGSTATILHAIAIWGWHVPVAFDAAVAGPLLHKLQHISFFGTAVLFWWSVLWRSGRGVAAWNLFTTMMHTGILGALMALSPRALYAVSGSPGWGLSRLEDQQLAGIVMWNPAGTVYAGAAMVMAALWIKHAGSKSGHTYARNT